MNTNNDRGLPPPLAFIAEVWKRCFGITWSIALLCCFTSTFGLRTGEVVFHALGGEGQPTTMYWVWLSLALYVVWQFADRLVGDKA